MAEVNQEFYKGFDEGLRLLYLEILKNLPERQIPETLWHYTTGSGLIEIIKTGCIWATQISCLNDSSEYAHSSTVLFKAFARLTELRSKDSCLDYLFQAIADNETHSKESPHRFEAPWFVTCLSGGNGDDLSQWRAYGGGENGYAIGFDASICKSTASNQQSILILMIVVFQTQSVWRYAECTRKVFTERTHLTRRAGRDDSFGV